MNLKGLPRVRILLNNILIINLYIIEISSIKSKTYFCNAAYKNSPNIKNLPKVELFNFESTQNENKNRLGVAKLCK